MTLWSVVVTHLTTVRALGGAADVVWVGCGPVRCAPSRLRWRRSSSVTSVGERVLACISCSRLSVLLSRPVWPAARSSDRCCSYSARETTLTLKSMCEW